MHSHMDILGSQLHIISSVHMVYTVKSLCSTVVSSPNPLRSSHEQMASIPVGGEEVPIELYFQVVDLWTAGCSNTNIIDTLFHTKNPIQPPLSTDTIINIIYNQKIMQSGIKAPSTTLHVPSHSSRRLSRIASVSELDDLSVAEMVAQKKEKERIGLRQMLAKLSA